jgi:NADH:ubiquinone oxidoreductase subunit 6 (subunit J)
MVNKTLITLNLTTKTSQKLSTKKRSFGYTVHLIGLHATVALLCVPVLFVLVYIMKAVALLLFAHATEIFFDLVLPVTACAFAVCVATLANPMHALLALVGVFLATVLFYVNSGIVFIGLVFLIVYVGAVAILFLFVIMLLNVKSLTSKEPLLTHPTQAVALFFGALLSYRLFADIAVSLGRTTFGTALQRSHAGNTVTSVDEKIYHEVMYKSADANAIAPLYTEHLLPFCLTTANLALSLFGAIVLAASTTEQTVKLVPAPTTSRLVDAPKLPLPAKLSFTPPLLRRGPRC